MTKEQILENLCYYDVRNPNCTMDPEEIDDHEQKIVKEKGCYCDNCFYGRTKLAEELLKFYLADSKV
jgi:hypothetical protein